MALDDVKSKQITLGANLVGRKGTASTIPFMGSRDNPDLPLATLGQHGRGYYNGPHFHTVDQFQVVIDGTGKIGRHELRPYSVHFSRAYTPYGPLVSSENTGLTHFVLRAHPDTDSQRLPQEREQLRRARRQPWQITRQAIFPTPPPGSAVPDTVVQPLPDMTDDKGLAAYTLSMKRYAITQAPDPSQGDGQFLIVVKGSLWHKNKEHRALALVFVWPKEGAYQIHAGSEGLEGLVLNFPRPQIQAPRSAASSQANTDFKTWQCTLCSFVYDEAAGLPEEGIAPGRRWEDVPATWSCPDCSSSKSDFQMIVRE